MQQKEVVKNERCTFEMYPLYWTPSKEGTFCVICTCQQKLDTKLKKSGIKNESMYKIHQLF